MQAIEFESVVQDRVIPLPQPQKLSPGQSVRVVVMYEEVAELHLSQSDAISRLVGEPVNRLAALDPHPAFWAVHRTIWPALPPGMKRSGAEKREAAQQTVAKHDISSDKSQYRIAPIDTQMESVMNDIAEKIHLIERLASNPAATANLLDKVIESLVESDRRKLAGFRDKLAGFEQRHGMSTAEFKARFDAGELGDAPEWFDWDGYAALAASLENKLKDAGVLRG